MKTIYKIGQYWSEIKPTENEVEEALSVSVPNDVSVGLMNSLHYSSKDYSDEAYASAIKSSRLADAKNYLASTDYVSVQWRDEEELGVEHSRTEEAYRAILQKRQEARELLRSGS